MQLQPNTQAKLNMLIVDDEEAILNSLRFLFHKDYNVTTSISGEDALMQIDSMDDAPDLVVSDERMAGMKGHELLEKIHNRNPETVCILATGYADMASLVSAVNMGHIYNYVEKPWVNADLKALVARAAEYQRTRSENIRLNQALRESNSELERRVEERTNELKRRNEQLRHEIEERKIIAEELNKAREEAEKAMDSKARFLSRMSHEIRTPMSGVVGLTELLQSTPLSKIQENYVSRLQFCSNRLLAVINNVLDFSQLDAGKMQYESIPFDVEKSFGSVFDIVNLEAERNGNRLSLRVGEGVPRVIIGDVNRIQQILINLVSNSNKFTRNGDIGIVVEVGDSTEEVIGLTISVVDTGQGISEDRLDTIFNDYEQSYSHQGGYSASSGLGLNICRQLVEGMGGRITVASEPGVETTFSFGLEFGLLPQGEALDSSELNFNSLMTNFGSSEKVKLATKSLRILVAEDDYINQVLILDILDAMGYHADLAEDGVEVLSALEQDSYDVVLMDVDMPRMNGIEATKEIVKRYREEERPRIIAATAYALPQEVEQLYAAGMEGHICKPFTHRAIQEILDADHTAAKKAPVVSSDSTQGKDVIDPDILGHYTEKTKAKMLASFRVTIPALLVLLEQHLKDQRYVDIIQECQAAKGVALNFGATLLVNTLEQLSAKAASENEDLVLPIVEKLSVDYQFTVDELNKLVVSS